METPPREYFLPNPKLRLREQLREVARFRHISLRTEQAYWEWMRRFIQFHRKQGNARPHPGPLPRGEGDGWRHPRDMAETEVRDFLVHLATERSVSASTQNQALNALVFLYHEVLGKELGKIGDIERPTRKPKLPTVLSKEETARLLAAIAPEYQLMVQLLYGTGMRLLECLRLRVKDVDFAQSKIEVHDGKGMKDRVTMLPEKLKAPLRLHLEKVKLWHEQDLAKGAGEVYLPFALASGIRGSVVECGGPPPLSRASTKGRVVLQMNARLRVVTTLETGIGRDAKFNRRYPPRDPAFNRLRGKLPEFPICSFAITTRRCTNFSFS